MDLLTFSRQCPFTENTPFLVTGVPGLFFVLVLAFFLDLHLHGTEHVVTISHTARQPALAFLFGEFFIIQVLFVSMCVANLGLIMMYVAAFILLVMIFIFNPSPSQKGERYETRRNVHKYTALIFFLYMLVVGIIAVVMPIGAFNDSITSTSVTVKRLSVVLMILLILSFSGMFYVMLVLNYKKDEPWTETVSYLERLFTMTLFIIILLIPEGRLV